MSAEIESLRAENARLRDLIRHRPGGFLEGRPLDLKAAARHYELLTTIRDLSNLLEAIGFEMTAGLAEIERLQIMLDEAGIDWRSE